MFAHTYAGSMNFCVPPTVVELPASSFVVVPPPLTSTVLGQFEPPPTVPLLEPPLDELPFGTREQPPSMYSPGSASPESSKPPSVKPPSWQTRVVPESVGDAA